MLIQYKILNNNNGVILTRQPKVIYDVLEFHFFGAPLGATAVFEIGGDLYYRELKENRCSLSSTTLAGEIKVVVALFEKNKTPKKWICEEIKAQPQKNGGILVSPNDLNLPQTIVDLKLENDEIRKENATIKDELAAIKKRLDEIMEAYDFT